MEDLLAVPPSDGGTGLKWVKGSGCESGGCVEVHLCIDQVLVRDSKDPSGPWLKFSRDEWNVFTAGVRNNEFDL